MPVSAARSAAFDVLLRVEREDSYASELLHSRAHQSLSTIDHGLATELVMGVLRWRSRLDEEISTASSQPLAKLDVEILIALRLAVYQFHWLDRVPKRAALNESVDLVKRARKRSAAPFVNAVLRKLSIAPGIPHHMVDELGTAGTLASSLSHPQWLVERWVAEYGIEAARQICEHDQTVPVVAIRLRNSSIEAELHEEGIGLGAGSFLSSARRVTAGDVTKTKAFRSGQIVIQDEASQLVAALIGTAALKDGARVLDCCAAPGGKTLAIADQNPAASIRAVELHPHRARLLEKMLHTGEPHSSGRIEVLVADASTLEPAVPFDHVLADVPCSGTGTLAHNPEIKWRLTVDDLAELQQRQLAILRSAMAQVAVGGRLIYSTCSLEKEECEDVVERALEDNTSFRLLNCGDELKELRAKGVLVWSDIDSTARGPYLRTIPGIHPCDGFFAAILERIS
jgi:16S rRNA (cytosine967-C5)-methyltransferase